MKETKSEIHYIYVLLEYADGEFFRKWPYLSREWAEAAIEGHKREWRIVTRRNPKSEIPTREYVIVELPIEIQYIRPARNN